MTRDRARLRGFAAAALAVAVGSAPLGCGGVSLARAHGKRTLTLLHLSDLHSHVFELRERVSDFDATLGLGEASEFARVGGLARLSTLVAHERALAPDSLLLDSGDAVEGTPTYPAFQGAPELLGLGALGVQAQAIGNHDLGAGSQAVLERYQRFAGFPLLAANYLSTTPDQGLGLLVRDTAWLRAGDLVVAVIGVGNVDSIRSLLENDTGFGVELADVASATQAAIDRARPLADVVVLLTHLGLEQDSALLEATSGADVVLGGHDHVLLQTPRLLHDCGSELARERGCVPRSVVVAHSGAYGKYLGVLRLELSDEDSSRDPLDRFEVVASSYHAVPANEDVPLDPRMLDELAAFEPPAEPALGLIAYAPRPIERESNGGGDSALGNLLTDTLRDMSGASFALSNTSSLRADLGSGPLSADSLAEALPFDDAAVSVTLSAAAFDSVLARALAYSRADGCVSSLQISGAILELDCAADSYAFYGADQVCVGACDGMPRAASISLGTSEYLAAGGSGYFDASAIVTGPASRQSLTSALRARIAKAAPCGALDAGERALACDVDADCSVLGAGFGCACDDGGAPPCALGRCVVAACPSEVLAFLAATCSLDTPLDASCALSERAQFAARVCATLPCLDARLGAESDGRIQVGAR